MTYCGKADEKRKRFAFNRPLGESKYLRGKNDHEKNNGLEEGAAIFSKGFGGGGGERLGRRDRNQKTISLKCEGGVCVYLGASSKGKKPHHFTGNVNDPR